MAKYLKNPNNEAIYQCAQEMWHKCFLNDDSLLFEDNLWTLQNLKIFYKNFVDNADATKDKKFFDKLYGQIANSGQHIIRLAAEMLCLYYLFPSTTSISSKTKKENIAKVLAWSEDAIPPDHILLKALDCGIGGTGMAYLALIFLEIAWLLDITLAFKQRTPDERKALSDPWAFLAFLDAVPTQGNRQSRHTLPHLFFPDTFERIATLGDKQAIASAFVQHVKDTTSPVDKQLFDIRKALEYQYNRKSLDFYNPPLRTVWKPEENSAIYTLQTILDDGCFLPLATLGRMLARLRSKKNIILQGPPGTGKTWLAKRLAWVLAGEKGNKRVQAIQFHATLSYEDFVCGWRPVGDGKLDLLDGPFLEALANAHEAPNTPHVLVIEEINRGNPAQIFGELLTLLEADKRTPEEALRLCYQKRNECRTVYLPDNLYIIGTMNIADRSLAIVDFALRRRFAFFDLKPEFGEPWQNWMRKHSSLPESFLTTLAKNMTECNRAIAEDTALGPQYAIGHSYVTCDAPVGDTKEWIEGIVATDIAPLLREYWFDNPQKAAEGTALITKDLI